MRVDGLNSGLEKWRRIQETGGHDVAGGGRGSDGFAVEMLTLDVVDTRA